MIELASNYKLVEVYGSLLSAKQREFTLKGKGIMRERGKVERRGWKLSFDRYSCIKWKGAVLNLVFTNNPEDVYYTTIYEVDDNAYESIINREMGKQTANEWKQKKAINCNSYRPIQLCSEFGISDIFIIPDEGREKLKANDEDKYVKTVREGIEESYNDKPAQLKANLKALDRAIKESKSI